MRRPLFVVSSKYYGNTTRYHQAYGQIGGISFYKMDGKYYARMKTCHSKERIQNDPAFAKTYQCGLDFGEASRTSKQLRHAWASVLPNVADNWWRDD
jgi:hypothetical protein